MTDTPRTQTHIDSVVGDPTPPPDKVSNERRQR
jgi:hypothetical protein